MSLTTGHQLRAGRALVDLSQSELAKRAGLSTNTISNMEARGARTLASGLDTIAKVQGVLEEAGVVFLPANGGGVGVRLRER